MDWRPTHAHIGEREKLEKVAPDFPAPCFPASLSPYGWVVSGWLAAEQVMYLPVVVVMYIMHVHVCMALGIIDGCT